MRRVRYAVAMSLDGYIAGAGDAHDWIVMDSAIDFGRFFKAFDTVLMGRRTFEIARRQGEDAARMPGMAVYVCSSTLQQQDYPDVTIIADAVTTVTNMLAEPGKDIWLMGGGRLFRALLEAGLVHTVEVTVVPVLLGAGVPLLPGIQRSTKLSLQGTETYPSGLVSLRYAVSGDKA